MASTSARRSSVLAIAGIALAQWLGPSVPAQAAVPVSMVGWWTRSPSPPVVPEGGIAVGLAPDGNVSVGAIQVDTAGGAETAVISLRETAGRGQQAASVQVCTTTDEWSTASGDDLDQAPRATCPGDPILLTRGDDGTWSADLASLFAGQRGALSVMVLPAPAPASIPGIAAAPPFELAFDKPAVNGSVFPERSASSESATSPATSAGGSSAPVRPITPSSVVPPDGLEVARPLSAPRPAVTPPAQDVINNLPLRATVGTDAGPSRFAVIGFVLASLLTGVAAAGTHWAHAAGVFNRLLPSGGGPTMPPPD